MLVAARAVVTAKVGAAGAQEWEDRWHAEAGFRRHIRVLTAVWGAGFALDAVVRVVLAQTLPIDAVPLVTGLQWVVVLGVLFGFHVLYSGSRAGSAVERARPDRRPRPRARHRGALPAHGVAGR
ncbi:hypothetical protein [Nocardia sp. NBC_01388]|uniref:hypothetical protein n=1 Tax=Nocardia sp. NBC_01388 TaxID=2903596 RepID=UPI0032449A93